MPLVFSKINNVVLLFTDIDECTAESPCHVNATCNNTEGSYVCECNTGFSGDGFTCEGRFCLSSCGLFN